MQPLRHVRVGIIIQSSGVPKKIVRMERRHKKNTITEFDVQKYNS
jgi:hypothetical protein